MKKIPNQLMLWLCKEQNLMYLSLKLLKEAILSIFDVGQDHVVTCKLFDKA